MSDRPWEGRAILHVDMDAFFTSVEQRDDPALRGKPVLVGHDGPRGVVAAASYEARKFGCRSAMPMAVAKRLCPQAIIVRGKGDAYREASDSVMEILESFTPLVQPLSIDEAFLDVTGSVRLLGHPVEMAREIKRRVRETTRLTCSVGVASCKFVAKIASDLNKPDGLAVIESDRVREVLWPLDASVIPGLGPASQSRLSRLGIRTVGEIAQTSVATLERVFGSYGERLHALANGIDDRPVTPDREAKSVGHEQTFGEDLTDPDAVRAVLLAQVEDVARRLRRKGLKGRTVTLKIRFGDFQTITRAASMDSPTDQTETIWQIASSLFESWTTKEGFRPVRLIGASVGNIGEQTQLGLFAVEEQTKRSGVDKATDAIVEKFGKGAIRRASAADRRKRE